MCLDNVFEVIFYVSYYVSSRYNGVIKLQSVSCFPYIYFSIVMVSVKTSFFVFDGIDITGCVNMCYNDVY